MSIGDVSAIAGLCTILLALGTGIFTLLWKLFRKVDQIDDTAATAEKAKNVAAAAAQATALVDKRLVSIESELTTNGGGSLKDDIRAIKASIPETFEQRDRQFARLAAPYLQEFRGHEERITTLETGQQRILARLDELGNQSASDSAKVLNRLDQQGEHHE